MLRSSSASIIYGRLTHSTLNSLESFIHENEEVLAAPPAKVLRILNLIATSLVLGGFGMCTSLFAPFFPTEAARRGVSATTVGLIFGVFTFVMFVGSIVSGRLVRHLGLHFMIGAGTLLAGGSTVLFGLLDMTPSGSSYVALCFIVRFVEGSGASIYNTAVFSMVATLFPENVSTGYAVLEMSFSVGCMLGPTVGGVLYEVGGFPLPFYVVGGLLLVLGFFSQFFLRFTFKLDNVTDGSTSDNDDTKQAKLPWLHFYKLSYESWILSIALASASIMFSYSEPTLAIYFQELDLTSALIVGLIFFVASLIFGIVSVINGKVADTFPKGEYLLMAAGAAIAGTAHLFMGPIPPFMGAIQPSVWVTFSSFVLAYVGVAMLISPTPSAIMVAAHDAGYPDGLDMASMVSAVYNGWYYFGCFVGTPLAGILLDSVGFPWGAFCMAVLGYATFVLLAITSVFHWKRTASSKNYARFDDKSASSYETTYSTFTIEESSS